SKESPSFLTVHASDALGGRTYFFRGTAWRGVRNRSVQTGPPRQACLCNETPSPGSMTACTFRHPRESHFSERWRAPSALRSRFRRESWLFFPELRSIKGRSRKSRTRVEPTVAFNVRAFPTSARRFFLRVRDARETRTSRRPRLRSCCLHRLGSSSGGVCES